MASATPSFIEEYEIVADQATPLPEESKTPLLDQGAKEIVTQLFPRSLYRRLTEDVKFSS